MKNIVTLPNNFNLPHKEMAKKTTTNKAEQSATTIKEKKNTRSTAARATSVKKPRKTKKEIEETQPAVIETQPAAIETQPVVKETITANETTVEIKSAEEPKEAKPLAIPALPNISIKSITELAQAPQRSIILTDQQIQQLSLEEIDKRYDFLEEMLINILDYDVVISDTNIWIELLIGHTSSHSDPKVNARLQFERQLEFISRMTKLRKTRFMIMGETYEEIDRFAAMQDPTNHKEADFTDNIVCLNTAARLAKRLILAQQKENRIKIEGISAESHHASFADPAIIRRVVELFSQGKKVLLITNDTSVAIRAIALCDDLQRINNISDETWNEDYTPLRPMVFTFEDLKLLDYYTRQYYYIQMASGKSWMQNAVPQPARNAVPSLTMDLDAFRPGDKHRGDNLFTEQEKATTRQQQNAQNNKSNKTQPQKTQQQQKKKAQQPKAEPKNDVKQEVKQQPKAEPKNEVKQEAKVEIKAEPQNEVKQEAKTEEVKLKKPRRKPSRAKKSEAPKE